MAAWDAFTKVKQRGYTVSALMIDTGMQASFVTSSPRLKAGASSHR